MNIQDRIINVLVEAKLGLLDESYFELAQLMEDRDILLETIAPHPMSRKSGKRAKKAAERKAAIAAKSGQKSPVGYTGQGKFIPTKGQHARYSSEHEPTTKGDPGRPRSPTGRKAKRKEAGSWRSSVKDWDSWQGSPEGNSTDRPKPPRWMRDD